MTGERNRRIFVEMTLPRLREEYERDGKLTTLLDVLLRCAAEEVPPPKWTMTAAHRLQSIVENGEYTSNSDLKKKLGIGRKPNVGAEDRATRNFNIALEALSLRDQGDKVEDIFRSLSKKHALNEEDIKAIYYSHCKKYPTTRALGEDGRFYVKKTGDPDSKFKPE